MVNIYQHLSSEQIKLLAESNLVIQNKDYTDDEYLDIFDQVTALLQLKGLELDGVNEFGIKIEGIIDKIYDL